MTLQWQGKFLEVHKTGTWEYAARVGAMGAAVILAITDAREIVLVEQFRHAHGRRCIELPAGLIGDTDAGDTAIAGGEAAITAAARELHEETGYVADSWESLGTFATSPGMSSEMFELFRAWGLVRVADGGGIDGEDITVHIVPLGGLTDFLTERRAAGCIIDCRLIVVMGLV
ncbi:MAG: NUDIX hydrolase [Sandarakinorhabdus sp.]|nr:NUDIX hydrolase [Sandarakinorhabdus sp.]